jgi:hypothetical protein
LHLSVCLKSVLFYLFEFFKKLLWFCVALDPAGFFLSKKRLASGSACYGIGTNYTNYDTGPVPTPTFERSAIGTGTLLLILLLHTVYVSFKYLYWHGIGIAMSCNLWALQGRRCSGSTPQQTRLKWLADSGSGSSLAISCDFLCCDVINGRSRSQTLKIVLQFVGSLGSTLQRVDTAADPAQVARGFGIRIQFGQWARGDSKMEFFTG